MYGFFGGGEPSPKGGGQRPPHPKAAPGRRAHPPPPRTPAAAGQLQLDVYGELMDAIYQARKDALAPVASAWAQQLTLVEHLERIWEQPDDGIWEVRGGRQHFTFSKIMAWVALDRSVRDAE